MERSGLWALAAGFALLLPPDVRAEAPDVVASIKPVHSLVAAVMAGVGEPTLLVKGVASPHTYALKPSDAAALERADLVFWVGEGFELFLARPLESLADENRVVELADTDGLMLLPPREGGLWEAHLDEHAADEDHDHDHDHDEEAHVDDHEHHAHGAFDGHLWLDPHNAKLMAGRIADVLADRDPANADLYKANGEALQAKLDSLDSELTIRLAPVKRLPFIVFHDAYQYFEKRYGLAGVGSITVSPEQPPGAKRLQEIRDKIAAHGARCVFREPNFEPALVDTVIAGTAARSGVLDPEGASLTEGPELYFDLMRALVNSLGACLASSS
ncbi:MAG: zinc ABC transporter substrate-binding protein ZnuA [Dongiaceae bacterium]